MNDELWSQVEAALDERRDPRSDPRLAARLEADPAAAAQVERLLARLGALRPDDVAAPVLARSASARSMRLWPWAAVLLVALGAYSLRAWSGAEDRPAIEDPARSITLVVSIEPVPPPTVRRVVLEPKNIVAWSVEGATQ